MTETDNFRPASKAAWKMLTDSGFEAYLIGGSVRDFIMGKVPGDIDITTNATPSEVESVFSEYRVIETGIKHGTVTVLIENEPVEITTYRSESGYSDNRHPDSVSFSKNLGDDVIRRDFTMNGIAFDFKNGFCDLVGGINDIEKKIIRCIGNPEQRFHEDSLRILRALRFSAVLGFEIEENTKKAIHSCRELLKNISAERIREETVRLVCGANAYAVMSEFYDVIGTFIPEILPCVDFQQKNRHHIYDVYTHILKAMEQSKPEPHLRLALLFHDLGKPHTATWDEKGEMHFYGHPKVSAELTDKIMARLRFDNDTRERVVKLVRFHDSPVMREDTKALDRRRVKKLMSQLGEELVRDLVEVKRCDNSAQAPEYVLEGGFYREFYGMIDEIILDGDCLTLRDLKIGGNDLLKMGFSGREIGEKLNGALEAVLDGLIPNEYDSLIEYIKR